MKSSGEIQREWAQKREIAEQALLLGPIQLAKLSPHSPVAAQIREFIANAYNILARLDNMDLTFEIPRGTELEKVFERYTLIASPIIRKYEPERFEPIDGLPQLGTERFYNSPIAFQQLLFTLCTAESTQEREFLDPNPTKSFLKDLQVEQVLQGMKILDLGAGKVPVFTMYARALGATSYTVDVFSVGDSVKDHHLQINLQDDSSVQKIEAFAGKEFDLITCDDRGTDPVDIHSNLALSLISPPYDLHTRVSPLLRDRGIYFKPGELEVQPSVNNYVLQKGINL